MKNIQRKLSRRDLTRTVSFSLQVSWVRRRGEELHLLTIGLDTYASDSRFSLAFEKPNDWRLLLRSATERDAGLYECQVSAHPPLIRTVHLAVSGKWARHCAYVHLTVRDLATSKQSRELLFPTTNDMHFDLTTALRLINQRCLHRVSRNRYHYRKPRILMVKEKNAYIERILLESENYLKPNVEQFSSRKNQSQNDGTIRDRKT